MYGRPIAQESADILRWLAKYWRPNDSDEDLLAFTELTNYSTVDATPLYVRLVARVCAHYGAGILDDVYQPLRSPSLDRSSTIRDSVRAAVQWIASKLEDSDLGMLEWHRMNPRGHRFQAWKDGATSYIHDDGTYANYTSPMASIEVQGLAFDALTAAPHLLANASAQDSKRWSKLAAALQRNTLDRFWMPDRRYFAMALDRSPKTGDVRQIRTLTSNPGALCDSGIFDGLEDEHQRAYLEPVVERLYSPEFLTPAGIRCTSIRHKDLLDYCGYQSSYTVWHKETYDIAKGLRRQGFPLLAGDLKHRMLNAVNVTGSLTEFLYAFPDNHVDFEPLNIGSREDQEVYFATNVPENEQAWTISAVLASKYGRGRRASPVRGQTWQTEVEDRCLRSSGTVVLMQSRSEIERARRTDHGFRIDRQGGFEREAAWTRAHEIENPEEFKNL
ncbi:MAG: hypothetical protein DLM70_07585 [Chloroflexi bacterium]|nr:MAG: hypothetical protein DLM70_07585 [Chloroflexota bacterium]